ncbi:ADP-ribosylation factor GTPase-activating protein 1 [Plecturocebus cupreus]
MGAGLPCLTARGIWKRLGPLRPGQPLTVPSALTLLLLAFSSVQGVSSKGWRDVTTFFSGKAEGPSDSPSEGHSYQNSGPDHFPNSAIDQSFWETFGSAESARARKSPSSDSWTCADTSTERRSSDSWEVWGSASTNRNSNSDGGEGGEGARKVPLAVPADDGWDNQNW